MAPQRPVDFWLKLLDRLINERFTATLEEHGLTRRQWEVMNLVSTGPATQRELDTALAPFLPAAGPGPADGLASGDDLAELLESGWLEVGDRGYQLSDQGTLAHSRLDVVVARGNSELARGISAAEYRALLDVLARMAANLGWQDPATERDAGRP